MEDSNPQENIAALHAGFLDRCANHYANLPCESRGTEAAPRQGDKGERYERYGMYLTKEYHCQ